MIKLFKIDELKNGIERFQTQLELGKDTASFIRENGIMKYWRHGEKGLTFYKYDKPFQIVTNIKEMQYQEL